MRSVIALCIGISLTNLARATDSFTSEFGHFTGGALMMTAVLGGEVQLYFTSPTAGMPHIKTGKLRALGITSAEPSALTPGIPTIAASGLPGYDVVAWFGMLAPAGTPASIINKLQAEAKRSLATPEVMRRMEIEGTDIVGSAPADFAREVKAEYEKWRELVKKTGMKS